MNSLTSAVAEPVGVASVKIETGRQELAEGPTENNNPSQETFPRTETEILNPLQDPGTVESARPRTVKSSSDSKLLEITSKLEGALTAKTKSDGNLQFCKLQWLEKHLHATRLLIEADSQNDSSNASVHDYENMIFLNVNRTDWGIRHWKSYSDIENSFHDNSICKVIST